MNKEKGVYFILNDRTKQVKIGCSNDIENRLNILKSEMQHLGFDDKLILLDKVVTDKYYDVELFLHNKFKKYRKIGEWFEIDKDILLSFIKEFKSKELYKFKDESVAFKEIEGSEEVIICDKNIRKKCLENINLLNLTLLEKGVLYSLFELGNFKNDFHIDMKDVCDYLDLSERNVRKYLKKLKEVNALTHNTINGLVFIKINEYVMG